MDEKRELKLIGSKELMELFKISRNTLQKWQLHGMPVHRATHGEKQPRLWFDVAEVEAWIRRDPIEAIKE